MEPLIIEQNTAESGAAPFNQDSSFYGIQKHRNSREAADAGLLLWRQNFTLFLLFFALPFWVIAFSLRLIFPGNLKYICWLLIWFLKPLFDRIILHIISIRFFDKDANVKRLFQGLWKNIRRGLAGDLLWRRFSPLRPAVMPVRVLERNLKTGKSILQRKQILKKGGIDYCFLITIWAVSVEIILLAGEIIFFIAAAEIFAQGFISSIDSMLDLEILIYAAWCLNIILIETIYVCMGFSLYINSRIEVEGWDIEIKFRGFAEKKRRSLNLLNNQKNTGSYIENAGNGTINIALIIIFSVYLLMSVKTFAEDTPHANTENFLVPYEELQAILNSPDFGDEEETWGIRFKSKSREENFPDINSELIDRLQKISAHILRFLLIGIIAGLIVFLIIYFKKNKLITVKKKNIAENTVFNNHSEDPKYLLEKALRFHEQGEIRLCWGYCAAAAIRSWTVYKGIAFPPNATENDCAAIINSFANDNSNALLENSSPAQSDTKAAAQKFDILIKNWVRLVYAGKLPPDGSFEEAVNFVRVQYG